MTPTVKVSSYSALFAVRCGALSYSSSNFNVTCVNAPQRTVNNVDYERTFMLFFAYQMFTKYVNQSRHMKVKDETGTDTACKQINEQATKETNLTTACSLSLHANSISLSTRTHYQTANSNVGEWLGSAVESNRMWKHLRRRLMVPPSATSSHLAVHNFKLWSSERGGISRLTELG